jgi:hypothetical protein
MEEMKHLIEHYLATMFGREFQTVEIAFLRRSFTGIPWISLGISIGRQGSYKVRGLVQKIILSHARFLLTKRSFRI